MLVTLVRTHYNRDISKGGALLRSRSPGVVPGSAHHHKEVMAMKKKIITVSREFGSGGRTIGKTVAQRLNIPYYDKAMHTLSGVFVAFLALCCFYFFKPGREIDRKDGPLCCLFVFAVSMAVAGLWEIGEYTVSCIDGSDPQLVLSTGVGDTMQDMIVCMVGTLLFVGVLAHWYLRRDDRRSGPLMGAFDTFYQYNLAPCWAAGQGGEKE